MKPISKLLAALILALAAFSGSVFAQNNVSKIDIEVTVRDDGSAYIVQNWRGEFYEGTENYIPISTEGISVANLTVSDELGEYSYVNDWDVDAGFEEKARKCAVMETSDGVELCFGISNYGEMSYTVGYEVYDFLKSYTDCDGTNFMFVNPYMSTYPTEGRIHISLENGVALCADNSAVWAFGYDGSVEFVNGGVSAVTYTDLDDGDSMIVMLSVDKGILNPETQTGISFETVKNEAFADSDYGDEPDTLATVLILVVLFAVLALVVLVAVFLIRRKKAIKKFYAEAEYFRDVPNGGKIDVSHYLARNFDVSDEDSRIIGALILSMINKGNIKPAFSENVGLFGKVKETVDLELAQKPDTPTEQKLYELLLLSAGSDGIVQEKELENYSYKHPEKITGFMESVKKSGEADFVSAHGFVSGAGNCIKDLSDEGKKELAEVMGLKKYLEEFTLIAERGIAETEIWKEYIIYATLFGIADKVIGQMKKVYPEKIGEIENYNRNMVAANCYCRSMYTSSQRAIQARRTSGGGGRASFGGGGGFSGGGRGGGSR